MTLRLPETLHQQLAQVAEREGVSLNQYIVYALTRQTANDPTQGSMPEQEIARQRSSFRALKDELGVASLTEIYAILADREVIAPEPELTTETIDRLREKLQVAKNQSNRK